MEVLALSAWPSKIQGRGKSLSPLMAQAVDLLKDGKKVLRFDEQDLPALQHKHLVTTEQALRAQARAAGFPISVLHRENGQGKYILVRRRPAKK